MFIDLDCNEEVVFKEIVFSSKVADALKIVTDKEDFLCFGSYEPSDDFLNLVREHGIIQADGFHELRKFFDIYRKQYPKGDAFYFKAHEDIIDKIVGTAISQRSILPFDHIVGFSKSKPKFSFHDAMSEGDFKIPGWVSPMIIEDLTNTFDQIPERLKVGGC